VVEAVWCEKQARREGGWVGRGEGREGGKEGGKEGKEGGMGWLVPFDEGTKETFDHG